MDYCLLNRREQRQELRLAQFACFLIGTNDDCAKFNRAV